jgi:hypothetical protein
MRLGRFRPFGRSIRPSSSMIVSILRAGGCVQRAIRVAESNESEQRQAKSAARTRPVPPGPDLRAKPKGDRLVGNLSFLCSAALFPAVYLSKPSLLLFVTEIVSTRGFAEIPHLIPRACCGTGLVVITVGVP